MTEKERRKGGGGKLVRSETVTVRLDPKSRYLGELAARKQRRTLSSYIEWSLEDTFSRVVMRDGPQGTTTLAEEAAELWDVDESDRFAKLALRHPDLLTHIEQVRWKLIRENGFLWKGWVEGPDGWTWPTNEGLILGRLREYWRAFCDAAENGTGQRDLPRWQGVEREGWEHLEHVQDFNDFSDL